MATDEALFLCYKKNVSVPTLRLYGWKSAAFSIGRSQNVSELLKGDACAREGIPIVRRPTGGGILFHDRELTYSFVLAQSDIGLGYRVKESYLLITSFLLAAYKDLGANASFAKDQGRALRTGPLIAPFCFSRREAYDIVIEGKKIGGNAQKRGRGIILQHGSIPLSLRPEEAARVTCVDEITQEKKTFDQLSDVIIKAFSFHFKTILKEGALTQEEERVMQELKKEKYAPLRWETRKSPATAPLA
jgi:lipoate-protein ligase A